MELTEDYVSFETAKLLKEKGFDVWCRYRYEYATTEKKDRQDGYGGPFGWKKGELNISATNNTNSKNSNKPWLICSRPTQSLACSWLRVAYKIHIYTPSSYNAKGLIYFACIACIKEETYKDYILEDTGIETLKELGLGVGKIFSSPGEATEAALQYALNELLPG